MEWIVTSAFLGYGIGVISCLRFRLRLGFRSFLTGLVISFLSLVAVAGWMVPPDWIAVPILLWFVGLFLQGVALTTRVKRTVATSNST